MGILSNIFLGETIRETQEIYRSTDAKDRIFMGLFRNSISDVVWLKFWKKAPIMGSSRLGMGISVKSFEDFHAFLDSGCAAESNVFKPDVRVPWILRLILRVDEGLIDAGCVGEYRCAGDPSNRLWIYTYLNRKGIRRVLIRYDNHFGSMDFKALEVIRDFLGDPPFSRRIDE